MTVYTTKTCGKCTTLKHFLNKWGVSYEEKCADDPSIFEEAVNKAGGQYQFPIVVEGDDVVVGFNMDRIKALI